MLKQTIMLVLSLFILPKVITTYLFKSSYSSISLHLIPTLPLSIIPEKLGHFHNCIQIYMWFSNSSLLPSPSTLRRHKPKTTATTRKKSMYYGSLCSLHFLILLYFITNISTIVAIHNNFIPFSSLCIIPTILSSTFLYKTINEPSTFVFFLGPSLPTISESSSNHSKLSYLCAWQSLHKTSHCLMNFNPGGKPICIDSGATCSISNNKSNFTDFSPTSNTILYGITSGLNIEGKGTLHLSITNDFGDDIDLFVRDSFYVPYAPMCLLS